MAEKSATQLQIETQAQIEAMVGNSVYAQERTVIAVDGRCGAGKTTLALSLAERFECNVFHLDDFYLSERQRAGKGKNKGFANADLVRFENEVLRNLVLGKPFSYFKYLPESGTTEQVRVDMPTQLSIVEGSFCTDASLREYYTLKFFLTAELDIRAERLRERGEDVDDYKNKWIPLEENFFKAQGIEENADAVWDTSALSVESK